MPAARLIGSKWVRHLVAFTKREGVWLAWFMPSCSRQRSGTPLMNQTMLLDGEPPALPLNKSPSTNIC